MNLTIIGTGYVGLVSGTCFADMGNKVVCVDIDPVKIEKLNRGVCPIFEPDLQSLILKNVENENLSFTTDLAEALQDSDVAFIAVGTPMGSDGSADLQYVMEVAKSIAQLAQKRLIVVDKSTVPVGTGYKVKEVIQKELDLRGSDLLFDVVSNPEFLREGAAIEDFMKPDRVIVGADSEFALKKMEDLYKPFLRTGGSFITMDIPSAEMTKYASNAMLATKISFINEIANICEKVGADINQVRIGVGSDRRIGHSFINPGAGYGGSCFPKDVKALLKIAEENCYTAHLIEAVERVNDAQKLVIAQKIVKRFGMDLTGFTFGIWGLAFKPGTDDMREAPAIYIIKELVKRGAHIKAYDPKALQEAQAFYLNGVQNITYLTSKYNVLKDSDALVLLTDWKEFRLVDFVKIKTQLKTPIIFDGRNQYTQFNLEEMGIEYHQIGKN